jgi:hypothetical protein
MIADKAKGQKIHLRRPACSGGLLMVRTLPLSQPPDQNTGSDFEEAAKLSCSGEGQFRVEARDSGKRIDYSGVRIESESMNIEVATNPSKLCSRAKVVALPPCWPAISCLRRWAILGALSGRALRAPGVGATGNENSGRNSTRITIDHGRPGGPLNRRRPGAPNVLPRAALHTGCQHRFGADEPDPTL